MSDFGSCMFSHWQDTGNSRDLRSFTAFGVQTSFVVYNRRDAAPRAAHPEIDGLAKRLCDYPKLVASIAVAITAVRRIR